MSKRYLLGILAIVLLATGCGSTAPAEVPEVTEEQKGFAIQAIMDYSLVRDAAISQEDETLSLVIIANAAINEEYAKELADSFVRLVKTFSEDVSPGKEIGKGIYDYLVGVYTPSEEEIVIGYKNKDLDHITW